MIKEAIWPVIKPDDRRLLVSADENARAYDARVATFFTDIKSAPSLDAGLDAQALYGEKVRVLDRENDWLKIQANFDANVLNPMMGYVGWIKADSLSTDLPAPTHRVMAPRTFLYPEADMKKPRTGYRSMGSLISVVDFTETRGTNYAILSSGEAVISRHIAPISEVENDYVNVAEQLLNTPYLWGGNTAFGIDCSGLVQLSMRMSGQRAPRDADMQAASIGKPIIVNDDWQKLKRGDLIFWRGHVAIAQGEIAGAPHIIHANGYTMNVTSEPAAQAVERIAHLYEMPIGVRRP